MSREDFKSILEVLHDKLPGALQLKWKTNKKHRGKVSDILRDTMMKHDLFTDHLHPLFPNGLEVAAKYKVVKLSNKKKIFGNPRSTHGYAAYTNGLCSHHKSVRRQDGDINKCPASLTAGFKIEDILEFISDESKIDILLCVIVKNDCIHKKHHHPNKLRGAERSNLPG
jgi:hypothetical protein